MESEHNMTGWFDNTMFEKDEQKKNFDRAMKFLRDKM